MMNQVVVRDQKLSWANKSLTQSHTGQDGGIAEDSGREFSCTQNHILPSQEKAYTDLDFTRTHAHTHTHHGTHIGPKKGAAKHEKPKHK